MAWKEATVAYEHAFTAVDGLFECSVPVHRQGSLVFARLKVCRDEPLTARAKDGREREAVVALERGRARLLAEALEQIRRDLELLPHAGHGGLYRRYREAAGQVRVPAACTFQQAALVEHRLSAREVSPIDLQADLVFSGEVVSAPARAGRARSRPFARSPGSRTSWSPPPWERIERAVMSGAPVVYLVTTSAGSLALIVRRESGTGRMILPQGI